MAAPPHSPHEMMVVAASREMAGRGTVFMGMSHPILAGCLAKLHHDPDLIFCTEPGFIDGEPPADLPRAPAALSDPIQYHASALCGDMTETLAAGLMGGRLYDLAMLPIGQIDRYGNGNTLVVGDYNHPVQRIGGMGGNPDGACLAPAVIFVVPHEKRRFPEQVDFVTSPGYLDGPGGRHRAGLDPQGPNLIVTALGILRYDIPDGGLTGSCEAYQEGIYAGVSVEQVRAATGWVLRVAPNVRAIPPPTAAELALLRRLAG